ncbi:MAG TPA: septal ring lytic transglycosylase RlpA family protein [Steroidobacteraceae bacterium]|nr:septal ring lytic transglycosylase RlpA family protein [Steroidobacteraceae bacterium]
MSRRRTEAVSVAVLLLVAACKSTPPRPAPPPTLPPPPPPADVTKIPDAVPRVEPRSRSGNPPFYEVDGRRYFVLGSSDGYLERGVASWYGPDFHGGRTATGETYDMYAMTAAHKTLPLPCFVQVTNLRNGQSVVVRVNDRGPFVANRLIDLSYSAAVRLGMIRDGTALVEVRSVAGPGAGAAVTTASGTSSPLPAAAVAPAPAAPVDTLYIQAGAFSDPANSERLLQKLRAAGIGPAFVRNDQVSGKALYRVRVGPVPSVAEFDRLVEELKGIGVDDARLAVE